MLPTTRREIYKRLSSTHGDRFLRHLFCICMLTIMFTDFGKMIFVCKYWWRQIFDLFHDHHDCCLCWHHDQDDLKKVQRRLQRSAEARWYLGKQHLGERGIRRNLHHHHECLPPLLMTRQLEELLSIIHVKKKHSLKILSFHMLCLTTLNLNSNCSS